MDAIDELKDKIIKDFIHYINKLNVGHREDYSMILHSIAFIESVNHLDNPDNVFEYLINN